MEIITSLIISIIAQIAKKFGLKDKFGGFGVHIFLLILALIASAIRWGWKWMPEVYAISMGEIWAGSVLIYEFFHQTIYKELIKKE